MMDDTLYIADEAHYEQVVERIHTVKGTSKNSWEFTQIQ